MDGSDNEGLHVDAVGDFGVVEGSHGRSTYQTIAQAPDGPKDRRQDGPVDGRGPAGSPPETNVVLRRVAPEESLVIPGAPRRNGLRWTCLVIELGL